MGLGSLLGKIGKAALNIGTGGIAGTIMDAAGTMGSVLGKQQEGAAQGKLTQAQLQQQQDRTALDRYRAAQDAQFQAGNQDLQRQQFATNNRGTTAKQALIGALLGGGMTPTSLSGGTSSGGLLRSLNANPEALAAMKALGTQGASAQAAPVSFTGGNVLTAPTATPLPQVDKGGFLSTLATLGQLAGAASPYIKKPSASAGDNGYGGD